MALCLAGIAPPTLQEAYRAVDQREQLDVAYTNFSNAFDQVNHDFLLYKIKSYNIHPYILMPLQSYLTDRRHRVTVDCFTSIWKTVPLGIPQGSILGPLLFTLFVNYLPKCLSNKCLLFTDDLKIFLQIGCSAYTFLLQADLDRIRNWSNTWRLFLNVNKCSVC